MSILRWCVFILAIVIAGAAPSYAQNGADAPATDLSVQQSDRAPSPQRVQGGDAKQLQAALDSESLPPSAGASLQPPSASEASDSSAPPAALPPQGQAGPPDHTMQMGAGGPTLRIRGFADFNLDSGQDANPLIFPLGVPAHTTFQFGEVDLFLSSRLSKTVSFLSEIVYGPDQTNVWGLDVERLEVTYKPSPYFEISGGRYHTSIGYYNTAFHHGAWFQTATGRPFMYYFEDSGGMLPVHGVGVTTTGLVPGTERLGLHWVAEVSNGRSSDADAQPVHNFLSDKDRKAFNVAAYVKPEWLPGVQVGGSFYNDRMVPLGRPQVNQDIGSFYVVYLNSEWEVFNEVVLLANRPEGAMKTFHSPLMYSQISRKFKAYRPYYRFQYVNVAAGDPINIFTGRYESHSVGLRMDFTDYVALKVQYNRLYQRVVTPENGLDLQMAFTF